jgi:hypothetical protein
MPSCHAHGNNAISIPAPQVSSVAAVHTPTVTIKAPKLSEFSQNHRTNSQYHEAPSADAIARKRRNLTESCGITVSIGEITAASKIVTALKAVASAMNAILSETATPCRSEMTSEVA